VEEAINDLSQEMREKLSLEMKEKGRVEIACPGTSLPNGKAEIDKELLTIEKRTRVENTREYVPNVIEPSFVLAGYCTA
jgi:glycyl-tRNA synthetase